MGRHENENEGVLVLPFNLLKDGKDVDRSISVEWSLKARFTTDDSISVRNHVKKVKLINILAAAVLFVLIVSRRPSNTVQG